VAEHRRLTIVGPPGSGKSMLLKHIALKWATGALAELPENPIPVLLELHHCSGETKPLREHLIDELEKRNRFPSAGLYLDVLLGSGQALLLLDGLDEVALGKEPGQRDDVVRQIRALLQQYHRCRVIITCRSAVYREEFADLTLQEYFAADRLQNDYAQLFEHFAQDPDGWLEPVKLWCGLASNSSALIEKVHGIHPLHPLAAFECLADAQEVETELADRILDEFTPALANE